MLRRLIGYLKAKAKITNLQWAQGLKAPFFALSNLPLSVRRNYKPKSREKCKYDKINYSIAL